MADLHRRCFTVPRAFTADEFADFMDTQSCFFHFATAGFVLGRVVADEAELLTIAVEPAARRTGTGWGLLQNFEATAKSRGAARAFLDVAASNAAAVALYRAAGYTESGCRRGYYRHPDGRRENAILMDKPLIAP